MTAVRPMTASDWPTVHSIFAAGIATGNATFEAEPPGWDAFDQSRVPDARLVACDEDERVIAWAAASRVSTREAYRGVIEHSIYVAPAARGTGAGRVLLDAFIETANTAGYWTIQSSIFPENVASLALHERAGFRTVGRRERIARMGYGPHEGRWRDTILIELRRDDETAGSVDR
ncbi:N-acetyltransferase family protein [Agromyces sp. Marseille-Q5079]|uniref:GNAT family N-acetyltransferase n=1 Tax=Agromyces sp. Marseille-Q5079 TaxID=3439059 RepID=UPI003D9CAFE1